MDGIGGEMKFIMLLVCISIWGLYRDPSWAQVKPLIGAAEPSELQQKARKLYERLSGTKVPIDSPAIAQMAELLGQRDVLGAAKIPTQDPNFYNITVKLMALELSTRDETIKTPFNDFAASFIGVTRDGRDARELLTGNFYYRGSGTNIRSSLIPDLLISDNHYLDLESRRVDLSTNLERVEGQVVATSATATAPNPDPAGVLTSRTFMGAHALMGTNRRLVEYAFREFLCIPLNEWADSGASDARIGRDIDRFPADDHAKFQSSCKGCHTVMDGFRGAFAKWDFDGMGIKHTAVNTRGNAANYTIASNNTGIVTKMNKNNDVYPAGHITTNDSFVNFANRSPNAETFEWRGATTSGGNGVNAFGTLLANSRRFSQCMATRVFKAVCRKELDPVQHRDLLVKWGDEFEASGYKLKNLFESISVKPECLGN